VTVVKRTIMLLLSLDDSIENLRAKKNKKEVRETALFMDTLEIR
jgi:hypothetical protein